MTRVRRWCSPLAVVLVVSASCVVLLPQAASASAAKSNTDSFHKSWTFVSAPLSACIDLSVKGTITYKAKLTTTGRGLQYSLTSIHLTDPVLKAVAHNFYSGSGCLKSKASLTKISMGQHWTGYSCSYNPSLSVAVPWAVAVSGWPSCSNRKQASYATTYSKGSTFTQNNTGSPTTFGNETSVTGKPHICYGVYVSTVGWEKNTSDSYGAGNGASADKVCLTPNY